jgi:hypothetical protein
LVAILALWQAGRIVACVLSGGPYFQFAHVAHRYAFYRRCPTWSCQPAKVTIRLLDVNQIRAHSYEINLNITCVNPVKKMGTVTVSHALGSPAVAVCFTAN